jgi:hypothetical protein
VKILAALALLSGAVIAADDGFTAWFPQFQAAVSRNDAKEIAGLTHFPINWELRKVRRVETDADFVAHFAAYFPADMKKAVAQAKPVPIPDGYMLTWKARGDEYGLYFKKLSGRWVLNGLSEGPP